ncbi:hypothetical protein HMPREF9257_0902 [Eremococcus coleocola ACS-139-V-Col8]|uniref:Uncharacterized protein n=1 Tax=Eremococcus coleocola ACS-139-V-Col8 TaxID=908337 RepID=E4KLS0_9LACT|nr:hypothetical protein HMPREF9257_0902 [Eremococcus coleocola ACS-139-V-Col8]
MRLLLAEDEDDLAKGIQTILVMSHCFVKLAFYCLIKK